MKWYLILILITLVLTSGVIISCNNDYEQRIANLEQQVAVLTKQVQELSTEDRLEPRVIEKDVEFNENGYRLQFNLEAGDRVEGEVSIIVCYQAVFSEVKDPYGNIIVESRRILWRVYPPTYKGLQKYPWSFAFIAATEGEYELRVYSSTTKAQLAHVKIVHYPAKPQ